MLCRWQCCNVQTGIAVLTEYQHFPGNNLTGERSGRLQPPEVKYLY